MSEAGADSVDDSFQQRMIDNRRSYEQSQERNTQLQDFDAIFSDNPDMAYFKQMLDLQGRSRLAMGKSMDDSIIGTETLADMMSQDDALFDPDDDDFDNRSKDDSYLDYQYYKTPLVDSNRSYERHQQQYQQQGEYSQQDAQDAQGSHFNPGLGFQQQASPARARNLSVDTDDAMPPQQLAIAGSEPDDLSTIANDTVNGSIMDIVKKGRKATGSTPRQRNFKEYNKGQRPRTSPQRSKPPSANSSPAGAKSNAKSNANTGLNTSGDSRILPGFIRVPAGDEGSQFAGFVDDHSDDSLVEKSFKNMQARSRRIYIVSFCLGVVLLAAIGALAITLVQLRKDETSTAGSVNTPRDKADPDFSLAPTDFEETAAPMANEIPATATPSLAPTKGPTANPSASPSRAPQTSAPTNQSFTVNAESFMNLIKSVSPQTVPFLEDKLSPQFNAFVWVASDAAYSSYTDERILQRFALACFASSIVQELSPDFVNPKIQPSGVRGRKLEVNTLTWMTYTDECDWVTSHPDGLCNESGQVSRIYLESLDLQGNLVPELALLADTLETLSLSNNQIRGTIPAEFGLLTKLRILDLGGNRFSSSIPTEFGNLVELTYLNLGSNKLRQTFPSELGNLVALQTLDMSVNSFSGRLPPQYGNLTMLETFDVHTNSLRGFVPEEYGNLRNLESFQLDGNDIAGVMPPSVCALTMTRSLDTLKADCHLVECQCCTECSPAPPTLEPTSNPTASPTSQPTDQPVTPPPTADTDTLEPTALASSPPTSHPTAKPTSNPTAIPTSRPTSRPTSDPTSPPTPCLNIITTDKSCYRPGERIIIDFYICNPLEFDWVGMYDAGVTDGNFLDDYTTWVWSCGTQTCRGERQSDTLQWNGNYGTNRNIKLHLFRNSERPYVRFASTPTIRIRNFC